MIKKPLISINIGSYNISGVISDQVRNKYKLIAKAIVPSSGVENGIIKNARQFSNSIFQLISKLEKQSGETIKAAHISISGCSIRSFYSLQKFKINSPINDQDIKIFISEMIKTFNNPEVEILNYFPIEFILDGNLVQDPVNMTGKELIIRLHIIGCDKSSLDNMVYNLGQCRLEIEKITPSLYSSCMGFLNFEEMNNTLVIDLGESTTTFGVFIDKKLFYIKTLNIGGKILNIDILKELRLENINEARKVKVKYASPIIDYSNNDDLIYLNENQSISNKQLHEITMISLSKIFEPIIKDLENHEILELIQKIHLIGGGANMSYINQFVEEAFRIPVKEIRSNLWPEVPEQDIFTFLPHYGILKSSKELSNASSISGQKNENSIWNKVSNFFSNMFS